MKICRTEERIDSGINKGDHDVVGTGLLTKVFCKN
jgi:hypothetical protein